MRSARGSQPAALKGGGRGTRKGTQGHEMALTRDFRETVQARARRDAAFRKGLLGDAIDSLLAGEVALGEELLRDYINATVGFPKLAARTKIHVKTMHQMFGPKGNLDGRKAV